MSMVDGKILRQMGVDVGEDSLSTLISYFVSDTEERIKAFQEQFSSGDFSALAVSAHTLKSVCAQYGVMDCSLQARELEALCRDPDAGGKAPEISRRIQRLIADLQTAMVEIKGFSM